MIAAIVIFSYLGFLSELTNIPISDLPLAGPDLVFITYPAALTLLPYPRVWIFFFFLTLILIGIDSQFGILEVISYTLIDLKPRFRGQVLSEAVQRLLIFTAIFIGGLLFATRQGFEILGLVNSYVIFLPMTLVGFLHVYIFGAVTSDQGRLQRRVRSASAIHQRRTAGVYLSRHAEGRPGDLRSVSNRLRASDLLVLSHLSFFLDVLRHARSYLSCGTVPLRFLAIQR